MKRFCLVLLALLLVCFCACAEDNNWYVDLNEHWKIGADGEKTDVAPHDIQEGMCLGCGAIVEVVEGDTYVLTFDVNGDMHQDLGYNADGECVIDFRYEYTYREDGMPESETVYRFGVLDSKVVYGYANEETQEGMYPAQQHTYAPDGSCRVLYMDTMGGGFQLIGYSAAGEELYTYRVENIFSDAGFDYAVKMWDGDVLAEEEQHLFDENGAPMVDKYYEMGVLVREDKYTAVKIADFYMGYISESITYHADGSTTVVHYDEYGRVMAE